jgi:hypothetical protein
MLDLEVVPAVGVDEAFARTLSRPAPAPPWPDCSVRRRLGVAFPRAWAALEAEQRAGSLPVLLAPIRVVSGEVRAHAVLRAGRFRRRVPVEVVLAPWSDEITELRLQLRSLTLPCGYFDVAHATADALIAGLTARAAQRRSHLYLVA